MDQKNLNKPDPLHFFKIFWQIIRIYIVIILTFGKSASINRSKAATITLSYNSIPI